MGLVAQVFDEPPLSSLRGHVAVGHCRYSTTGSSVWENAQPTFRSTATGSIALAHNGNLVNTGELAKLIDSRRLDSGQLPYPDTGHNGSMSDTDMVTELLADYPDRSIDAAAMEAVPHAAGAIWLAFSEQRAQCASGVPT